RQHRSNSSELVMLNTCSLISMVQIYDIAAISSEKKTRTFIRNVRAYNRIVPVCFFYFKSSLRIRAILDRSRRKKDPMLKIGRHSRHLRGHLLVLMECWLPNPPLLLDPARRSFPYV